VCALQSADYQKLNAHFYLSGKDARYVTGQMKLKPTNFVGMICNLV